MMFGGVTIQRIWGLRDHGCRAQGLQTETRGQFKGIYGLGMFGV